MDATDIDRVMSGLHEEAKRVIEWHADRQAKAVLAERERCARVAEGFEQNRDWAPGSLYDAIRRDVAAAIRSEAPSLKEQERT